MADNKKVTKRDNFASIRELLVAQGRTDLIEFVDHEVELLNKKHGKTGPTKEQKLNEVVKGNIASVLATNGEMRSTAIASEVGISVQKCTALLKQMVESGTVVRNVNKKVTTFTLA